MSCAPSLQSTSTLISIVHCRFGVIGTLAKGLVEKCCLWDNNKLQSARRISLELLAICWTISLSVRITDSGPKYRDDSVPALESEKIMLLFCRLKVKTMSMEMNISLTSSNKGESAQLCQKGNDF